MGDPQGLASAEPDVLGGGPDSLQKKAQKNCRDPCIKERRSLIFLAAENCSCCDDFRKAVIDVQFPIKRICAGKHPRHLRRPLQGAGVVDDVVHDAGHPLLVLVQAGRTTARLLSNNPGLLKRRKRSSLHAAQRHPPLDVLRLVGDVPQRLRLPDFVGAEGAVDGLIIHLLS